MAKASTRPRCRSTTRRPSRIWCRPSRRAPSAAPPRAFRWAGPCRSWRSFRRPEPPRERRQPFRPAQQTVPEGQLFEVLPASSTTTDPHCWLTTRRVRYRGAPQNCEARSLQERIKMSLRPFQYRALNYWRLATTNRTRALVRHSREHSPMAGNLWDEIASRRLRDPQMAALTKTAPSERWNSLPKTRSRRATCRTTCWRWRTSRTCTGGA